MNYPSSAYITPPTTFTQPHFWPPPQSSSTAYPYISSSSRRNSQQEPSLHPLLETHAHYPPLLFDVACPPIEARSRRQPYHPISANELCQLGVYPATTEIRLESDEFPWTVRVRNQDGVTLADVLENIYLDLQEPTTMPEWKASCHYRRRAVQTAYEERCQRVERPAVERNEGIRRVDWLEGSTAFVGLERHTRKRGYWIFHFDKPS